MNVVESKRTASLPDDRSASGVNSGVCLFYATAHNVVLPHAQCALSRWAVPHRDAFLLGQIKTGQTGRFRYWLPEGLPIHLDRLATNSGPRFFASARPSQAESSAQEEAHVRLRIEQSDITRRSHLLGAVAGWDTLQYRNKITGTLAGFATSSRRVCLCEFEI
jgi:hypothetical protein